MNQAWKKSSFSTGDEGSVEVNHDGDDVLVRNSNGSSFVRFDAREWKEFVAGIMNNEFDVEEV